MLHWFSSYDMQSRAGSQECYLQRMATQLQLHGVNTVMSLISLVVGMSCASCAGRGWVVGEGDRGVAGRAHQQPGLPAVLQPGCWPLLQRSHTGQHYIHACPTICIGTLLSLVYDKVGQCFVLLQLLCYVLQLKVFAGTNKH